MEKVGLFAGVGQLPVEFMRAAKMLGHEVVVIAVVDGVAPELEQEADAYYAINVAKLDKVIKTMKKEGVTKVTMIGKVTKEILFKGLKFPDLRAIKLLAKAPQPQGVIRLCWRLSKKSKKTALKSSTRRCTSSRSCRRRAC